MYLRNRLRCTQGANWTSQWYKESPLENKNCPKEKLSQWKTRSLSRGSQCKSIYVPLVGIENTWLVVGESSSQGAKRISFGTKYLFQYRCPSGKESPVVNPKEQRIDLKNRLRLLKELSADALVNKFVSLPGTKYLLFPGWTRAGSRAGEDQW